MFDTLREVVSSADRGSASAETLLEAIAATERMIAQAHATQLRLLARFASLRRGQDGVVSEFAADEVAPLLRVSRFYAASRLALATDLVDRLPLTLSALDAAQIDVARARAISELTGALSDEQAAAVEAEVLPRAATQTAPQVRAAVRRAVLRVDPGGGERREAAARADRRIVLTPAADGMAELYAFLPAAEATAIYDRVHRLARARVPKDTRSADQRRADCFTDLLLGAGRRVSARINVTVSAAALLGTDEEPGQLDGYGPISADAARSLAGGALTSDTTWRRILTHPVDGSVLDVGRHSYRPPAALADVIRARDKTCRFPGCRQPASRCDIDHTIPYPDGPTAAANLGLLCRHHHRLKHETDWSVAQDETGRFVWTSPTGRHYAA